MHAEKNIQELREFLDPHDLSQHKTEQATYTKIKLSLTAGTQSGSATEASGSMPRKAVLLT